MSDSPKRQRRGHGRPTLHDVADAADVTRITVSRFMRMPELVAEETAQRIREAIEQIGYVPNRQAGQLASGHSRLVAALIPNVGHSIFAETIQGLAEGLHGSGHELLLLSSGYSLEREEQQLRALVGWSPGALIVTGRRHTPEALRLLKAAQNNGAPVIEMWDHPETAAAQHEDFAQIGFDHFAVGRMMAAHLLDQGHRSLAYVDSGVAEDYRAHERGEGFAREARRRRARVVVLRARPGDAFDAGREVLPRLLEHAGPVTAAAFANDHLACGALLQAQALQVPVPQRIALLGFGDFPIGRQLRPAISTVRPPTAEIGRATADALLASIASGEAPESKVLACELLPRDSTFR